MNTLTKAVICFKESGLDSDFNSVWTLYSKKINSIVNNEYYKYNQIIDIDVINDYVIDALLLSIKTFNTKKNVEFSTHFVYSLRSQLNLLYRTMKTDKRKIMFYSESIFSTQDYDDDNNILRYDVADSTPNALLQLIEA